MSLDLTVPILIRLLPKKDQEHTLKSLSNRGTTLPLFLSKTLHLVSLQSLSTAMNYSTMTPTLYANMRENARLTHQKSLPALSANPSSESYLLHRNSMYLAQRGRLPSLPPKPRNSPPPIPTFAPDTIRLPNGERIPIDELLKLISMQTFSTPPHVYRPPTLTGPIINFRQGQDRFPARECWWHSSAVDDPHRYVILPGSFDKQDFQVRWNKDPRFINDTAISALLEERMFSGIYYRIDVDPIVWGKKPLRRGDTIVFRGFKDDRVKYVATWQRSPLICNGMMYVQFNAMDKDQYHIDAANRDWPSIGFYVPIESCAVDPSPPPSVPCDPQARVAFIDPFSTLSLPSAYDDTLNLVRIRRNAHVPSPPRSSSPLIFTSAPTSPPRSPPRSPRLKWLQRKLSDTLAGIGKGGD
jgi:hypothetical protein